MHNKTEFVLVAVAAAVLSAFIPAGARAGNARSFVSGHGSDSNNCALASPCRSLAQAITATNPGGEIDVLDPAGYGSVTISKAISIVNDGVGTSSILVPSGQIGITIAAGGSDAVSLRGLTIDGEGAGQTGIDFITGNALTVENCVIRHVAGDGIEFSPEFNPTNAAVFLMSNTVVADNGGTGVFVNGSASSGTLNATVSSSIVSNNGGSGFSAGSGAPFAATTLMLFHVVAANNGTGLSSQGGNVSLRVAQSMVTGNQNGWTTTGTAVLQSYGDNYIDGNANNETAPPSTSMK